MLIEARHKSIPIRRQCELPGLSPSTLYYKASGADAFNELLMRLIDKQHLRTPFYGGEEMRLHLNRLLVAEGVAVNAKRVRRLMRLMGLETIYSKPSRQNPELIDSDVVDPEFELPGLQQRRMAGEPEAPSLILCYEGAQGHG